MIRRKNSWRYPTCYLTHRGGLCDGALIRIVRVALDASGHHLRAEQWENAVGQIQRTVPRRYQPRKILLLAHSFVDIR